MSEGSGRRGFTLVELLVVVLIIGVMTLFAFPSYRKTVETNMADTAASFVLAICNANRTYSLDHGGAYAGSGAGPEFTNPSCNTNTCMSGTTSCELVGCKYLNSRDFDNNPYQFSARQPSDNCLLLGTGFIACAIRRTSGANSTTIAPYNGWGYTCGADGNLSPVGGAPAPTQ